MAPGTVRAIGEEGSMPYRQGTDPAKIEEARRMRAEPTQAEALLWDALRRFRPGGAPWSRQVPMYGYIADFYCAQRRIVVEADGSSHEGRSAHDRLRDEVMRANGINVLRFSNDQILGQTARVLQAIHQAPPGYEPRQRVWVNTPRRGAQPSPIDVFRGIGRLFRRPD